MNALITLAVPLILNLTPHNTQIQNLQSEPIKVAAKVQQDIDVAKRIEAERKAEEARLAAIKAEAESVLRAIASRPVIGGNTYALFNCTFYVKSRRPDLPNNLGNANTWVIRAAAQGWPTGRIPKAGAVGQHAMHVIYVEAVYDNGTILISELNYDYHGSFRQRLASASDFMYIY